MVNFLKYLPVAEPIIEQIFQKKNNIYSTREKWSRKNCHRFLKKFPNLKTPYIFPTNRW